MQIILATDTKGKILDWYYQKLSSPDASALKSNDFRRYFIGLTLGDFFKHDYFKTSDKYTGKDKLNKINDPTKNSQEDFRATLRGIRKNLVLLDQYWLNKMYEPYWHRSQKLLKNGK